MLRRTLSAISQQILRHRSRGSFFNICQNKQVTMQRTFAFTANRSLAIQSIRCNRRVGVRRSFAGTRLTSAITNGTKCKAFFNFGNNNNDTGAHPCDLLLLMSAKEGDTPKVEELLGAGANPAVKDKDGKTPLDLCDKEEVKEMLQAALAKAS
ncbi:putative Protein LHCP TRANSLOCATION DEFECT [Nannochloris sp. 'desiccata']|nr:putative Protein LHCP TRANSLOCATION DEFECT [Chlorella desiccata (nom. nud.)]